MARKEKSESPDSQEEAPAGNRMGKYAPRVLPSEVPRVLRDALVAMISPDTCDRRTWPESEIAKHVCRHRPAFLSTAIEQCGFFIRRVAGSRLYRGKAVDGLERKRFDIRRLERILAMQLEATRAFGDFTDWCSILAACSWTESDPADECDAIILSGANRANAT